MGDESYLKAMLAQLKEPDQRLLKSWHHELESNRYFYHNAFPAVMRCITILEISIVQWNNQKDCYECQLCSRTHKGQTLIPHMENCILYQLYFLQANPFGKHGSE